MPKPSKTYFRDFQRMVNLLIEKHNNGEADVVLFKTESGTAKIDMETFQKELSKIQIQPTP
jgi:hypothetical protein